MQDRIKICRECFRIKIVQCRVLGFQKKEIFHIAPANCLRALEAASCAGPMRAATASCRFTIAATRASGRTSHCRRRRRPAGVAQFSTAARRVPSVPPVLFSNTCVRQMVLGGFISSRHWSTPWLPPVGTELFINSSLNVTLMSGDGYVLNMCHFVVFQSTCSIEWTSYQRKGS